MICKIFIDKEHDEEVIIYAHERNALINQIEQLTTQENSQLIGYIDKDAYPINPDDIYCFISEGEKVFALSEKEKYRLKTRLYKLEEILSSDFVKINQSCIININKISRFTASIYGTLGVKLKNGYTDYVSRRNLKKIKERFGL